MLDRLAGSLSAATLILLACGQAAEVDREPTPPAPEATPISGMYEVSGTTVDMASGFKREISGTIVLTEGGPNYAASFELTTTYPGAEQPVAADVIGRGEGTIEDRTLRGVAHTQLVMATVPGVDPNFAYIPRRVSTRLISTSVATISREGTLTIEIENQPEEGEDYSPTRTTLRGSRIAAAAIGGEELP